MALSRNGRNASSPNVQVCKSVSGQCAVVSISTSYRTTRRAHQTYESPSSSSLRRGRSPRPTLVYITSPVGNFPRRSHPKGPLSGVSSRDRRHIVTGVTNIGVSFASQSQSIAIVRSSDNGNVSRLRSRGSGRSRAAMPLLRNLPSESFAFCGAFRDPTTPHRSTPHRYATPVGRGFQPRRFHHHHASRPESVPYRAKPPTRRECGVRDRPNKIMTKNSAPIA